MYIIKYNFLRTLLKGFLFIVFCVMYTGLSAQDTSSTDDLFQMARKAAFDENDYPKAKNYCNKILTANPHYIDATVFLGMLYAWNKQYDSAKINFQKAL